MLMVWIQNLKLLTIKQTIEFLYIFADEPQRFVLIKAADWNIYVCVCACVIVRESICVLVAGPWHMHLTVFAGQRSNQQDDPDYLC